MSSFERDHNDLIRWNDLLQRILIANEAEDDLNVCRYSAPASP